MWRVLNSRKFAFYVLAAFLITLFLSALLPNNYTVTDREWYALQSSSPNRFWLYSHLSTPFLVKNPFFQFLSFLLFLSTLSCTVDRVLKWHKSRTSEFVKEKAFSFSAEESSAAAPNAARDAVARLLSTGGWDKGMEREGEAVTIYGEKGLSGFWGSVIFHVGLLVCFLAGPVTALTGFRGELAATENVSIPLRAAIISSEGRDPASLPDTPIEIRKLRGEYYRGEYRYDFGGVLALGDRELPFEVNKPANDGGYQYTLHEYGYAPHLVMERGGEVLFDYYLNLRHPDEGDYFELPGGLRGFLMFFPDFFMEGGKIGSRSKNPVNPVTLVKLYRGDREVFKGLFKPGEAVLFDGVRMQVPDFRRWVTMTVTREEGILLIMLGSILGVAGLLARFMSNERRIEFEITPVAGGTGIRVRGYSRYYPAFLEKEVLQMTQRLKEDLS